MKTFRSFDGAEIAYRDEGDGPAVILLHGYGVDGLGQFGSFDYVLPTLVRVRELFLEAFGKAPPLPDPPSEGRAGLLPPLLAAGARVLLPDLRGFGASAKPTDPRGYSDSAMARDVIALVQHLRLDEVDAVGFSMGAGVAGRLLALEPPQVRSAILAGIGDYAIEGSVLEFPESWPIPKDLDRPLTHKSWAEEGARVLEGGEIVPGHLASAHVIAARAAGADPKVLAAVIRGAVAEQLTAQGLRRINAPVLVLNGAADVANQKTERLLREIPTARLGRCEGDHYSTPYQPSFHGAVIEFLRGQWRARGSA